MSVRFCLVLALGAAAGCGGVSTTSGPEVPGQEEGGTALWGRRFGKSTSLDRVAVAVDGAGSVVIGGRFFATADFGGDPVTSPANNWQAFVAKYDAKGALVWIKSFGDVYEEQVSHIGVDSKNNVYVAGSFRGTIDLGGGVLASEGSGPDIFVAKLAPDGSHVWSKRFGVSGYDNLTSMAVDPSGGIVLLGTVGDGADLGTGPVMFTGAPFVAKLADSGDATFVTAIPHDETTYPYPTAVANGPSGSVVVALTSYKEQGGNEVSLLDLGPKGDVAWQQAFPSDSAAVSALAVASDGTIFLTGTFAAYLALGGTSVSGNTNGGATYVASFGGDGSPRWLRAFVPKEETVDDNGAPVYGSVLPAALAATGGGVVMTGGYTGSVDFGGGTRMSARSSEPNEYGYIERLDDVFTVRLDAAGDYLWDASFDDPERQDATSVAVDPAGDVLVAGSANGVLPFASGALDDTPYYEGFLVKLAR